MKKFVVAVLFLFGMSLKAQIAALPLQQCFANAGQATVSGLKSTNYQEIAVPSCTVTIYLTGTSTLATYYLSPTGNPQTGPFTASSTGQWLAYLATSVGYDVVLSGGIPPNMYPAPVTFTDIFAGNGGASETAPAINACTYAGSDLGARIIAAYTANPAPALITVPFPCASWITPITLPSTDSLYIQAGAYTVSGGNKLLGSNLIYGDGFGVTTLTLQNSDASGEIFVLADGSTFAASNVSISQMTLNGNRTNQSVTTFGTGLVTMGSSGTSTSNSNIQIAAQFLQCKVNCIAGVTVEQAPMITGLVMTGSHINGSGQSAVYLQGVSAPTWANVDISNWGLDTAASDAIYSTGQIGTGGIGAQCPYQPLGGQWIGGVLNNTANATKFAIEETSFGPGCQLYGGTVKGITSYGAPNGSGGNGISIAADSHPIEGNSLIPPPTVTNQTGNGGMELSLTNSAVNGNTVVDGNIVISNSYVVSHDVQLNNNYVKVGLTNNGGGIILGGGGAGSATGGTNNHFTVTGGDIDMSGSVAGTGILIGEYAGTQSIVNDVKIEAVNIHQDSVATWKITSWSITGNVATVQGSFAGLYSGFFVTLSGFTTGSFFNGQTVQVSATGFGPTQFEFSFTHANASATETGTASGQANSAHGIFSVALDGSKTLQMRHNTFTNLSGGFGDQPGASVGMTDIDYQDNTLRGNTSLYDNFPPVAAVSIRPINNSITAADTNQYLQGLDSVSSTGFIADLNGIASGDVNALPLSNLLGSYPASAVCPNASLSAWTDSSGNGNTLTASGGTYGTCVASDLNGYPAVRFAQGTTYPYVNTSVNWPYFGYVETVYIVHKKTVGTSGTVYDGGPSCFNGGCSAGAPSGWMRYDSATVISTGNGLNHVTGTVTDDGGWHLDVVQSYFLGPSSTLNSIQVFHDGTLVGSLYGATVDAMGLSGITIGGVNYSNLSSTATGDIADVEVYSADHATTQILGVDTYLAYKYGLTIANSWSIVNGALTNQSVKTGSVIDTGIATSPNTSPICPNGTGGAFTTSGCNSSGTPLNLGSITYNASGTTTFAAANNVTAAGKVTATHSSSTTFSPTGLATWGSYTVEVIQDSTGGGVTFTLGTAGSCSAWKVGGSGGGAIALSSSANTIDVLAFTFDGANCIANFRQAFN